MGIFDSIKVRRPQIGMHNLSFDNKLTTRLGVLTPVFCKETLPGDVFRHSHEIFAQFAPLNSMLMQRFDIQVQYFHVPVRQLYDDFEKFLVGGDDGKTVYVPPYVTFGEILDAEVLANGTLVDYLGLPTFDITSTNLPQSYKDEVVSLLPFRAYQHIYNCYYRDENLIAEVPVDKTGGHITTFPTELFALRNRAWHKDYFTSALPWAQKGDQVILPLGDKAPIVAEADTPLGQGAQGVVVFNEDADGKMHPEEIDDVNMQNAHPGTMYADLSNATAATIDELRTAEMVQEWLEANARGGTRYNEQVYNHFGVRTPDARLDRPEFIQSTSQPVQFGNIYSTTSNNNSNVQAVAVSNGASGGVSKRFRYYVREHGFLIGILSVVPKASYYQGIPRMFSRMDKFDYYWPEFAHLGEQAIYNRELYVSDHATAEPGDEFGYTPRYADYKTSLDEIHGDYRDNLRYFHDARIFGSQPTLSQDFIEINQSRDSLTRIFNNVNANNDKIWLDVYHHFKGKRLMPYFGTPKFSR